MLVLEHFVVLVPTILLKCEKNKGFARVLVKNDGFVLVLAQFSGGGGDDFCWW